MPRPSKTLSVKRMTSSAVTGEPENPEVDPAEEFLKEQPIIEEDVLYSPQTADDEFMPSVGYDETSTTPLNVQWVKLGKFCLNMNNITSFYTKQKSIEVVFSSGEVTSIDFATEEVANRVVEKLASIVSVTSLDKE